MTGWRIQAGILRSLRLIKRRPYLHLGSVLRKLIGRTMNVSTDKQAELRIVGKGVARVDGLDKVQGRTQYTDDLDVPGCWHGFIVRSPVSRGRLKKLTLDAGFDWSKVVVATSKDIPGPNIVVMHDRSMPLFAFDEIRYIGEPLAVVAAPTLRLAKEAAAFIRIEVEELPPVLTLEELVRKFKQGELKTGVEQEVPCGVGGFAGGEPASPDVLCSQAIVKGDIEKGFAEADQIIEAEYTAGHQEQLYIEPQGLIAIPQKDGSVIIQGSLQCPYYVQHEIHEALNLPEDKVRVKQAAVGGAFGGKEEFPSMLAGYCALPAMKSGHPVKIVYDRHEDILFSTKRHPVWVRHKTGLKKDGTITAMRVDFLLDGGAYLTLSDVVMYRGILHAAMGYRCENVFVNGLVGRTNVFPSGAFRGFGAPQGIWGIECQVDALARACGMAPHEFRLKNCLHVGDTTPTGMVLRESVGSPAVLEEALRRSKYAEKLKKCSHGKKGARKWYGIGVSFFAHGAGFTGDGESKMGTRTALEIGWFEDGRPGVLIRASSTEMGQGSFTVLSQMAAEGLGVDLERIRYPYPDTGLVPNSGPTVASRTTMVVGSSIYNAAAKLRKMLEESAGRPITGSKSFEKIASKYLGEHGPLRVYEPFQLPDTVRWDQKTFRGDAYPAFAWGSNVAEVEIDTLTYEIKVKRVTAVYDIGRVINPVTAKGQIEGGLTQALGYAVMEKIGIKDGRFDANRLQTYIIPTALDVPEYDIRFIEFPYAHAAPGAKGVGEMPMDGLAPAIANAIEQAIGIRLRDLPITPEKILAALK